MASVKRPVDAFRRIMLHRLRENRGRGGWAHESPAYLLSKMISNTTSLLHRFRPGQDITELIAYLESAAELIGKIGLEMIPEVLAGQEASLGDEPVVVTREQQTKVCSDAADIANFAMMIADNFGDLRKAPWIEPPTKEETKELVDSMEAQEPPTDAAPAE